MILSTDVVFYTENILLRDASYKFTHLQLSPEDDQSILIETSSWNQRFFSEPPQLIRDSHYMVLPQTFPYRISTMQSLQIVHVIETAKVYTNS